MESLDEILEDDDIIEGLQNLVESINEQIREIEKDAMEAGVSPYQYRTPNGDYVMAKILGSKAQAMNALITLQVTKRAASSINYYYMNPSGAEQT